MAIREKNPPSGEKRSLRDDVTFGRWVSRGRFRVGGKREWGGSNFMRCHRVRVGRGKNQGYPISLF